MTAHLYLGAVALHAGVVDAGGKKMSAGYGLLVVVLIGVGMYFMFRSMNRHLRKVHTIDFGDAKTKRGAGSRPSATPPSAGSKTAGSRAAAPPPAGSKTAGLAKGAAGNAAARKAGSQQIPPRQGKAPRRRQP